jgi:ACT domain-containing protein
MIKWCGWLSLLFLVLTYVFSVHANVNKENSWINDIWLSDNFLITAFSGVFASLLVVLLSEIRKYLSLKSDAQRRIYDANAGVYITLHMMKNLVTKLKTSQCTIDSVNKFVPMLNHKINDSILIDYTTFKSNKKYTQLIEKLEITKRTISYTLLYLTQDIVNHPHNVNFKKDLSKISKDIDSLISEIDQFNRILDDDCGGRYKWEEWEKYYSEVVFPLL